VPKNEDGEFELILGNRQLFSVFFIVVMLFGVFFVMGYIVGQNSAPLGRTEVASARKNDVKPIVVDSPGRAAEVPAAAAPEPPAAAVDTPPVETAPQRPPTPEKRPEKAPEKPKPEPKPEPKAAAKATPPPAAAPASGQPTSGDYLQLVATAKGQADDLVDVLRKNGFKALNYEVPEKPGLFRVLVGPVKDGEMNKLRADLQGKGFQGREAIPKKF
jgi:cell division septation protein DedD